MAAAVDIANLALGRVGHKQRLAALTDRGIPAVVCNALYPTVRDRCLQRFAWPWAEVITPLTLSATTIPGWGYAYTEPTQCLRLMAVCDSAGARAWSRPVTYRDPLQRQWPQQPYRIFHAGTDDDLALIVTDVAEAYAIYVRRVEAVDRWPPLFQSYVAWELAAELALALEVDADRATTAIRMARDAGPEAAGANLNESADDPEPDSPSIQARG